MCNSVTSYYRDSQDLQGISRENFTSVFVYLSNARFYKLKK